MPRAAARGGYQPGWVRLTVAQEGDAVLPPFRERASARARHVRIEISPDGIVWLIIPRRVPRAAAYAFLRERAAWVRRKVAQLRTQNAGLGGYGLRWDGSDHLLLQGRERDLRLVPSTLSRPRVRWQEEVVEVFAPGALRRQPERLDAALTAALRERARAEASVLLAEEARRLEVAYLGPRIADQRSLWGSCSARGLISLNWRLILAPPAVFRYVVVHELCHVRHPNHSMRFWTLLARQLPDYAHARAWLQVNGARLQAMLPRSGRQPQTPDLFEMHEQQ